MKKPLRRIKNLSITKKVLLGFGSFILLVAIFGNHTPTSTLNANNQAHKATLQPPKTTTTAQSAAPLHNVVTSTATETQVIPFTSTSVSDANLAKGTSTIVTSGVNGSQTLTYKITTTNGTQTDKTLLSTVVTQQPVTQVTHIGSYIKPAPAPAPTQTAANSNCDPNYSGACVPNVYPADVDCAGGSGNGPYYVRGPVQVVGVDRYGLDRDGDGVACE